MSLVSSIGTYDNSTALLPIHSSVTDTTPAISNDDAGSAATSTAAAAETTSVAAAASNADNAAYAAAQAPSIVAQSIAAAGAAGEAAGNAITASSAVGQIAGAQLGDQITAVTPVSAVAPAANLSEFRSQIESAVNSVKTNATTAHNPQAVRTVVDRVLATAGIDPAVSEAAGINPQTPGARQLGLIPVDGATTVAARVNATSPTDSLLTSHGINASSFKHSLETLVADPSSTAGDFSELFRGARVGSDIDIAA